MMYTCNHIWPCLKFWQYLFIKTKKGQDFLNASIIRKTAAIHQDTSNQGTIGVLIEAQKVHYDILGSSYDKLLHQKQNWETQMHSCLSIITAKYNSTCMITREQQSRHFLLGTISEYLHVLCAGFPGTNRVPFLTCNNSNIYHLATLTLIPIHLLH